MAAKWLAPSCFALGFLLSCASSGDSEAADGDGGTAGDGAEPSNGEDDTEPSGPEVADDDGSSDDDVADDDVTDDDDVADDDVTDDDDVAPSDSDDDVGDGQGGGSGAASGGGPGETGGSDGIGGSDGSAGAGEGPGPTNPGACGEIPTFADGLAPEREVHVAVDGDDGNDGSVDAPVASLERGLQLATPGTAVRIHEGTYAGDAFVSGLVGEADAPIWVGGAPGEARPLIEGGGQALHLVQPRYVVLHDLEVAGQEANGINVDDGDDRANEDAARHLVFRNLYIHDIGTGGNQDCLKLSGVNDHFVLDSRFERCGDGGSAIDHVGCHRGLLAGNVVEDVGGSGIQSKGGSDDIEIRGNLFRNAGERPVNLGGSTGFEFFRPPLSDAAPNYEARNIRAIANVFVGSVAPVNFVGCAGCLAANNTIIDPERWIVRILQETVSDGTYEFLAAQNGRFINNLVVYSRGVISTHVNVGESTDPASFEFANNLWYASDSPGDSTPDLPVEEMGGRYGEDPLLVAPDEDDFTLGEGSPAAGAGQVLGEVGGDFAGACYLDPPSIGAFER